MNRKNKFNLFKSCDDFNIKHISEFEKSPRITSVFVYQMLQFIKLDASSDLNEDELTNGFLPQAGFLAGIKYAKKILNMDVKFDDFVRNLQDELKAIKIAYLRIEAFDLVTGDLVITIRHEFESCEIPIKNNNVFIYDESFITGILETYTGKKYEVHKMDSWYSPVIDDDIKTNLEAA